VNIWGVSGGNMKKFCEQCGKEILTQAHPRRRFCDECTLKRRTEYKREWARQHSKPITKEQLQKRYAKIKEKQRKYHLKGLENGEKVGKQKLYNFCKNEISGRAEIAFNMPFTYNMSKNHIWSQGKSWEGRRTVYKRDEARVQEQLIIEHLEDCKGIFKKNKVWLDIFVEKPDNKGDAVNFVDLICDAVKKGIDIDDRWFSLGRVDWQIVKGREPLVFIRVYQEDNWDATVCSYCGRLLPKECFRGKNGRECKECLNKSYCFSDEELHEIIEKTWIPEEFYENGDLSDEDELDIQKWIVHQRLYGEEKNIY